MLWPFIGGWFFAKYLSSSLWSSTRWPYPGLILSMKRKPLKQQKWYQLFTRLKQLFNWLYIKGTKGSHCFRDIILVIKDGGLNLAQLWTRFWKPSSVKSITIRILLWEIKWTTVQEFSSYLCGLSSACYTYFLQYVHGQPTIINILYFNLLLKFQSFYTIISNVILIFSSLDLK